MSAPITEFVDVTINLAGGQASKFGFNAELGAFSHAITANRQDGPYFNIGEVNTAGFTAGAAPTINAWATAVFAQQNGIDRLMVGRVDGGDADIAAALDAIELVDPNSWYVTTIEDRDDASLGLFGTWTEARNGAGGMARKIGIGQSDDLTVTAFLAWQAATLNRSAGIYHDDDAEYLDGAWASKGGGLNLDRPGGAGIWGYQEVSGVPFDNVTGAEATAIYAANANILGRNESLNFTSKGTMASGRFIDVTTTVDWLAVRIQEAVLTAFVSNPTKVPYDNAGINTMANAIQGVLDLGITAKHLLPAAQSLIGAKPEVQRPDVKTISSTVKQTRVLPMTATGTISGAIQKVELTVNLIF